MSATSASTDMPRHTHPPALSAWLAEVTDGLCEEACTRMGEEYAGHFHEHVDAAMRQGQPEADAIHSALAALGAPGPLRRKLRRRYLLQREAVWLAAFRTSRGHAKLHFPDIVFICFIPALLINPVFWLPVVKVVFTPLLGMYFIHPAYLIQTPVAPSLTDAGICTRIMATQTFFFLLFVSVLIPFVFAANNYPLKFPPLLDSVLQLLFLGYAVNLMRTPAMVYMKLQRARAESVQ